MLVDGDKLSRVRPFDSQCLISSREKFFFCSRLAVLLCCLPPGTLPVLRSKFLLLLQTASTLADRRCRCQ